MPEYSFNSHTSLGTAGGILTIFLVNISSGDVMRTAILAAIGAIVSYSISHLLKYCIRRRRK
jgi:Na+-translocating ferredoxin:NAD+ oxidoreductase RnfA subunit